MERSFERPSSKWRRGLTQSEIAKAEEESVQNAILKTNQGADYPDWWGGYDEIEKSR
jgi:hypothetical protein